jgi:hypothetical protein
MNIEERSREICATGVRQGEAKSPPPWFQNPLPAQEDPTAPAGKCPSGGGNAPPPDENGLRAEYGTASGGDADGVSVNV